MQSKPINFAHIPALGLPGFSAALENRPDQSPRNENLDGSAVSLRFQNPATPQPLRPLRFQKRTFTAPIITQFDTFNQSSFLAAF
jgi:hypothetical protein